MSLGHPLSRQSFSLHGVQVIRALLRKSAFGRGRGRTLEPVKLLQGMGLEGGSGAIVGFMGQVVLNAVEADTASSALVVVCKRQGRENTAAAAMAWDHSQAGPLAEVNRAISFWARAVFLAGRNLLLHCQAQDGGRWCRSSHSSGGSGGGSGSVG